MYEPATEQQRQQEENTKVLTSLYAVALVALIVFIICWAIGLTVFVQTMNEIKVDRSKCVNWCETKEIE